MPDPRIFAALGSLALLIGTGLIAWVCLSPWPRKAY